MIASVSQFMSMSLPVDLLPSSISQGLGFFVSAAISFSPTLLISFCLSVSVVGLPLSVMACLFVD